MPGVSYRFNISVLTTDTLVSQPGFKTRSNRKHQRETRIEGRGNSCKTFFSQQSIKCHQKKTGYRASVGSRRRRRLPHEILPRDGLLGIRDLLSKYLEKAVQLATNLLRRQQFNLLESIPPSSLLPPLRSNYCIADAVASD